jgi:hypothetical protein
MVRPFPAVTLLAVLAAGAACGRARAKPSDPAPAEGGPASIDVAKAATDAHEAARALMARYRDSAAGLAPVSFAGTARSILRQGDHVLATLDEVFAIDADRGAVHARVDNSQDAGRELYSDGGTVWVRTRYGKLHRRAAATADEVARAVDDAYGTLAAQVALVADGLGVTDGGPAQELGRPGRKILLHAAGGKVVSLTGEAILDDKTGTVLAARLEARVALDGGRALDLRCDHALRPLAGPIELPGEYESIATPLRSTDTDDREELLRGLAPPIVKRK